MGHDISAAVTARAHEACALLTDLISIPSTPGNETDAIDLCRRKFGEVGCECEVVPVRESLKEDPEYSHAEKPMVYDGRGSLVARRRGLGVGRSVILQSHVDVVPAGDWEDAFKPTKDGSVITGRGACDAKGHVAAIWLAIAALREVGAKLKGEVQAQIVIEEELGGNGALDLIRKGCLADAAIVMESTDLNIHPANRGAIWFRIDIEGLPAHMGRKFDGVSAIDKACRVIQALYEYEARIIADSKNYPGFERYESPVQVNVGMLHAGAWPSMVAGEATIEGGVGFLPNRSMDQVKREITDVIETIDDPWLKAHYRLSFPKLHNDSYEIDYSHPAVTTLRNACGDSGISSEVFGWNVSCDARLYAKLAGIPTIVFGPGDFTKAHARDECIDFNQIINAAEALARFAIKWCG
jgi:acetylornithine deacetylase